MVTDELKINSRRNLERTLGGLSSFEEQLRYKSSVPFVHVTTELLEQWANHERMLREADWYRELYSLEEQSAFARLDKIIEIHGRRFASADVPEIFQVEAWSLVRSLAREALDTIGRRT